MEYEQLKLENQLCFPVYAASRLITREYQPHLDALGITYPQYLVLMVLWENDGVPISVITDKLILNTNTVTPLLKRMQAQGLLSRQRSNEDERKVIIRLTEKAWELREEAAKIPEKLSAGLLDDGVKVEELIALRDSLHAVINSINNKKK